MEEKYMQNSPIPDEITCPPADDADAAMESDAAQEEHHGAYYDAGSITTRNGRHTIHCLTIIGQIEGHYLSPSQNKTTKYEHVIPQLVAVEEDPKIDGLLILLNTVGGDIEAGLALAELVAGMAQTHRVACFGRWSFDWRATGCCGQAVVYCVYGVHDDPPGACERPDFRRSADHRLF